MTKRINGLPVDPSPGETNIFETERGAVSYRLSAAQLRAIVVGGWQSFIGTFLAAANVGAAQTAIDLIPQASAFDPLSNRVMKTGSAGILAPALDVPNGNNGQTQGYSAHSWTVQSTGSNHPIGVADNWSIWDAGGANANRGFSLAGGVAVSRIAYRMRSGAVNGSWYELLTTFNASTLPLASGAAFAPTLDNLNTLGASGKRWSVVWAGTGTISTSDARHKTDVRALTADELKAARELGKEIGAYKFLDAVAEKGDEAREHIGMTVQRAIEIMAANGLDPFGYSFICYDEWPDEVRHIPAEYEEIPVPAVLGDDGEVIQPARVDNGALLSEARDEVITPAGSLYSFRQNGLLSFVLRGYVQAQEEIEHRLSTLEGN